MCRSDCSSRRVGWQRFQCVFQPSTHRLQYNQSSLPVIPGKQATCCFCTKGSNLSSKAFSFLESKTAFGNGFQALSLAIPPTKTVFQNGMHCFFERQDENKQDDPSTGNKMHWKPLLRFVWHVTLHLPFFLLIYGSCGITVKKKSHSRCPLLQMLDTWDECSERRWRFRPNRQLFLCVLILVEKMLLPFRWHKILSYLLVCLST